MEIHPKSPTPPVERMEVSFPRSPSPPPSPDNGMDIRSPRSPAPPPPSPLSPMPSPDVHQMSHHSAVSFQDQSALQESNIVPIDPYPDLVTDDDVPESPEAYTILPGASQRASDLLIQGGYIYGKDKKLKSGQRWKCTVRNKSIQCRASVMQSGNSFVCGPQPHTCNPNDCAEALAKVRHYLRKEARSRPCAPASAIVREGLQYLPKSKPIVGLPKIDALIRAANKTRQKRRPKHPCDQDSEVLEENFTIYTPPLFNA